MTVRGAFRHYVTLQNPAAPVADGDGGFTTAWADLTPSTSWARIEPATASRLERLAAGTVQSNATHVVTLPYHAGVTTKTRILFGERTFTVTGVSNLDERQIETVCLCTEVVA